MPDFLLIQKLRELCQANSTLLWLEGSQHEKVNSVRFNMGRLILQLSNGTCRVVHFDRYAITAVGLQFWHNGKPGVLYRWDNVPRTVLPLKPFPEMSDMPPDEPPPDLAA